MIDAVFWFFAVAAVIAALACILQRNPVAAALFLVQVMFCLAAIFVLLDAQFIAAIQVLVYAGAVMVLFLFVIMLLNLGHPSEIADKRGLWASLLAVGIGVVMVAEIMVVSGGKVATPYVMPPGFAADQMKKMGAVGTVAAPLFNEYLLAFELTSVVLLVAIVGAVVLGKRRTAA